MRSGREVLQAVTFDATGTLFHSPERGRIYSEVLGRHGLSVDAARAEELIQQVWQEFDCGTRLNQDRFRADPGGAKGWWRRFLERIAAHLDAGSPSPFAAAELFERFSRAEAWQVFPEVAKALDRPAGPELILSDRKFFHQPPCFPWQRILEPRLDGGKEPCYDWHSIRASANNRSR